MVLATVFLCIYVAKAGRFWYNRQYKVFLYEGGKPTVLINNSYEDDGEIPYFRSEGSHRLVKWEDLFFFLQQKGILMDDTNQQKQDVIYARVSSHE